MIQIPTELAMQEWIESFLSLAKRLEEILGGDGIEAEESEHDPAASLGGTVALWLLLVIASYDSKSKVAIMEAGAIGVLTEKLGSFVPNSRQAELEDSGSIWVTALLLAILFQERDVTRAPETIRAIPSLALLLRSEEATDRYFAAQALASLICNGTRGTLLAVANSGVVGGLIPLLGSVESDISNLVALSEEFSLIRNPGQVALERLFTVEDIRFGATAARKAIPALVDLLKPIPDRPGAPPLALALLKQVTKGSNVNKLAMAEAGALDALAKYLSLRPQDAYEKAAAELLRILFSNTDLRRHESAGAVDQLVTVLRLGTRGARLTAARALEGFQILAV